MPRFITALSAFIVAAMVFLSGAAFTPAAAAADADALKQAKTTCKSQVKEYARYNEMSRWAQHKAVKKCIQETLAGH
jgi:hypothetical protein